MNSISRLMQCVSTNCASYKKGSAAYSNCYNRCNANRSTVTKPTPSVSKAPLDPPSTSSPAPVASTTTPTPPPTTTVATKPVAAAAPATKPPPTVSKSKQRTPFDTVKNIPRTATKSTTTTTTTTTTATAAATDAANAAVTVATNAARTASAPAPAPVPAPAPASAPAPVSSTATKPPPVVTASKQRTPFDVLKNVPKPTSSKPKTTPPPPSPSPASSTGAEKNLPAGHGEDPNRLATCVKVNCSLFVRDSKAYSECVNRCQLKSVVNTAAVKGVSDTSSIAKNVANSLTSVSCSAPRLVRVSGGNSVIKLYSMQSAGVAISRPKSAGDIVGASSAKDSESLMTLVPAGGDGANDSDIVSVNMKGKQYVIMAVGVPGLFMSVDANGSGRVTWVEQRERASVWGVYKKPVTLRDPFAVKHAVERATLFDNDEVSIVCEDSGRGFGRLAIGSDSGLVSLQRDDYSFRVVLDANVITMETMEMCTEMKMNVPRGGLGLCDSGFMQYDSKKHEWSCGDAGKELDVGADSRQYVPYPGPASVWGDESSGDGSDAVVVGGGGGGGNAKVEVMGVKDKKNKDESMTKWGIYLVGLVVITMVTVGVISMFTGRKSQAPSRVPVAVYVNNKPM